MHMQHVRTCGHAKGFAKTRSNTYIVQKQDLSLISFLSVTHSSYFFTIFVVTSMIFFTIQSFKGSMCISTRSPSTDGIRTPISWKQKTITQIVQ